MTAEQVEMPVLLTKEQVGVWLQVSPRTVWEWGAEGRLDVVHLTARELAVHGGVGSSPDGRRLEGRLNYQPNKGGLTAMKYRNVRGVPLCTTGSYQLASGERTFSEEDLADAVLAAKDPTVPAPRVKLGHTDPRFAAELDGEPAFGTIANLRLSGDRQTIIGDYEQVPEWLADSLTSAYPGRSIEGGSDFTAGSGRKYRLVISACALLGVTWPGVTSLADLRDVMQRNGRAPAPISARRGGSAGGRVAGGRAGSLVMASARPPVESHESTMARLFPSVAHHLGYVPADGGAALMGFEQGYVTAAQSGVSAAAPAASESAEDRAHRETMARHFPSAASGPPTSRRRVRTTYYS